MSTREGRSARDLPAGQQAAVGGADDPHILIVDNELAVLETIRTVIEGAGSRALEAMTVRDARDVIASKPVMGVIVELLLSDGSGLDLLTELRDRHVHIPALVISGSPYASVANRAHLLRASCVFKPDIAPNIRAFVKRTIAASADISQRTLAAASEVSSSFGLTAREHEILELVALGVPRERLASELGISENTLKTLIRRVLHKCKEPRVESLARAVLDEVLALACTAEPI